MTERGRARALWSFVASARLRIIGWMLLLTLLGLLAAGTAVFVLESDRIDQRADRNIAQEFGEVDRLVAEEGTDGFGSPDALLEQLMRRNVAQHHEIYLGLVDGHVRYVSYGPGGTASSDLAGDQPFLDAITSLPDGGFGTVQADRGEVRFGVRPIRQGDLHGAYVVAYLTDPWRGEFVAVMQGYGLVALLTLLVVALGGWLVAGQILRPVADLEATARGITETDLGRRIRVKDRDNEVSRLARTFNAMLDRLSAAFDSQRQFLDDAGHELATPITILRGHLELLDGEDPSEVEETRALLLDELDRMEGLTKDLTTLAKSERPDFLRRVDCDLGQLTDDALRLAGGLGRREWVLDSRAEGRADVDPQRLVQAVLQLAANAVRYTGPDDQVAVGSALAGGELALWVRDTGPGVAPEEHARIFDRFSRGSSSRGKDGSGLGLAIVSAIAEAHGGGVELDSEPGSGARFTLRVPVRPRPDAPGPGPSIRPPATDPRPERSARR